VFVKVCLWTFIYTAIVGYNSCFTSFLTVLQINNTDYSKLIVKSFAKLQAIYKPTETSHRSTIKPYISGWFSPDFVWNPKKVGGISPEFPSWWNHLKSPSVLSTFFLCLVYKLSWLVWYVIYIYDISSFSTLVVAYKPTYTSHKSTPFNHQSPLGWFNPMKSPFNRQIPICLRVNHCKSAIFALS